MFDRHPYALVAVFASLSFSIASPVANAGELLDRIAASGRITIAHRDASIPFSYLDADGRPIGYAMDMCARVVNSIKTSLKRPDLQVSYLQVKSSTRIDAVASGQADIECGSTTNTAERRKRVSFSIPYFIASARMVVRNKSGIKNWADLRAKTIVTTAGTTNDKSLMDRNDVRALNVKLIKAPDHLQAFNMVVSGEADAFAMDDVLLYGLRANAVTPAEFVVVGDPLTIEPYALMMSKTDAEFKKLVDAEMANIIQSGDIYKIYEKWFQRAIPPKNAQLAMPMGWLLRSALRFPSDKVADD